MRLSDAASRAVRLGDARLDSTRYVGDVEGNWVIAVTAPDAVCTWSAVSDAEWLVVKSTIPPAPAGSGDVRMRANLNTNHKRVGHVQINGSCTP